MASEGLSPRARPRHCDRRSGVRRCRGLTLVELMVAIAISLFMVAALVVLYVNNSAARTELDRSSRQIENGRFAIDMLRDDIALAGFYGQLAQREINEFVTANPCATATAQLGWATAEPWRVPTPVQGPNGGTDIPAAWACAPLNQRPNTGYIVVRRLSPAAVAPAAAVANTHYLQTNGCLDTGAPFRFATGPGAANFTLTASDCASPAPLRVYQSRLYYVANCGICSPSDGIPTLKMRELQGNEIVERVIADGIEDLQLEFGIDTNGDGLVNQTFVDFTDLDAAALGPSANWGNVVAVRVRLISRATAPSPGYVDDKAYDRGQLFAAYSAPGDGLHFKRRSYTALVHLPNVGGPRELP